MQQTTIFQIAPGIRFLVKINGSSVLPCYELDSLCDHLRAAYDDPDYSVVTNYNFSVEVINDNVR